MATYWENSCSFGLRYVSWYKYLIVSLVFSHLGFWSGNLFLIAPFPDLCLLVLFSIHSRVSLLSTKCVSRTFGEVLKNLIAYGIFDLWATFVSHFDKTVRKKVLNQVLLGFKYKFQLSCLQLYSIWYRIWLGPHE